MFTVSEVGYQGIINIKKQYINQISKLKQLINYEQKEIFCLKNLNVKTNSIINAQSQS